MNICRSDSLGGVTRGLFIALVLALAPAAQVHAQGAAPAVVPAQLVQWPDTIYTNAKIITFSDTTMNDNPGLIVQAMAVRDEIIIALGSTEEVMRLRGKDTKIIDLQGKVMLPGFVHAHNHIQGPAEQKSFDIFNLSQLTPGYYLNTGVEWTADEIKEKVKKALADLRQKVTVEESEWIGIQLFPDAKKGFPSIATVSNLMGTYKPEAAEITKADLDQFVPDRMFELTVAASVQDRPRRGFKSDVWYKLSVGEKGAPVWTEVIELKWTPWVYAQPVKQREVIDFGDEK
jgi:hypothetical protein